jgi:hypothetical protein
LTKTGPLSQGSVSRDTSTLRGRHTRSASWLELALDVQRAYVETVWSLWALPFTLAAHPVSRAPANVLRPYFRRGTARWRPEKAVVIPFAGPNGRGSRQVL